MRRVSADTSAAVAGHMPTAEAVRRNIDKYHYARKQGKRRKS